MLCAFVIKSWREHKASADLLFVFLSSYQSRYFSAWILTNLPSFLSLWISCLHLVWANANSFVKRSHRHTAETPSPRVVWAVLVHRNQTPRQVIPLRMRCVDSSATSAARHQGRVPVFTSLQKTPGYRKIGFLRQFTGFEATLSPPSLLILTEWTVHFDRSSLRRRNIRYC